MKHKSRKNLRKKEGKPKTNKMKKKKGISNFNYFLINDVKKTHVLMP